MESAHSIGLLLVGLSAGLLASHWQQRCDMREKSVASLREEKFQHRQLRRRTLASSLVGLLGAALTVYDQVPPGPLSISFYLFGLIFLTFWILCLGLIDLFATRQYRHREQIDRIAAELRRTNLDPNSQKSVQA